MTPKDHLFYALWCLIVATLILLWIGSHIKLLNNNKKNV